jgi:hypothetical protein
MPPTVPIGIPSRCVVWDIPFAGRYVTGAGCTDKLPTARRLIFIPADKYACMREGDVPRTSATLSGPAGAVAGQHCGNVDFQIQQIPDRTAYSLRFIR